MKYKVTDNQLVVFNDDHALIIFGRETNEFEIFYYKATSELIMGQPPSPIEKIVIKPLDKAKPKTDQEGEKECHPEPNRRTSTPDESQTSAN